MSGNIFRVNMQNVDAVLQRTGTMIDVAKIYGSKTLMEDMEKNLKTEYMKVVGKSRYQSGITLRDSRNLMNHIELDTSGQDRLQIKVKDNAVIQQAPGSKGANKVEDILDIIQKGWAQPAKNTVFRLAPDRPNLQGVMGGFMQVGRQSPKPFVANTVKNYTTPGVTNAGSIMEREIAKILKRGI